ncbi:hypothetical protein HDU98_002246 [Podochytrium sp. JEL0797]|nr:hypothetical protein HDU98_002246 [Podochytrium sp. JEL0797]
MLSSAPTHFADPHAYQHHSHTYDLAAGLLCGGLANLVPSVLTNPFDSIKTRIQVQPAVSDLQYKSFSHAASRIMREEGWRGLILPGMFATCIRELTYSSLRFGLYAPVKTGIHRLVLPNDKQSAKGSEPFLIKVFAAVSIGCIASAITSPTDLVKIRLQREAGRINPLGIYTTGLHAGSPPSYRNTMDAFIQILKRESLIHGLYKGWQATAIRASLVTGAQLSTYDETKYLIKKHGWMQEGIPLHVLGSVIAGLAATTAGAPADIIKTRLLSQQKGVNGAYSGFVDCFVKIVRTEGPAALFRGWLPAYCRLAPHFIISLPLYEQLRKGLGLGAM